MMKKASNKRQRQGTATKEQRSMSSSTMMKKVRNKRQRRGTPSSIFPIQSLPRDLLVEVIASVASHSFIDLLNMKKCSKEFLLDAGEEDYVCQRVSLDTFHFIDWFPTDEKTSFLERCLKNGNIECLYRKALREYFKYPVGNIDGLESLKTVAQKGHKEANYVYGMILLSSKEDELRNQGLEHMRFLRKSKCVVSCRNNVKKFLSEMWKENLKVVERNQGNLCNFKSTCKGWRTKLHDDDDGNLSLCEYCRWDHELEEFYQLLYLPPVEQML